MCRR
ncbi:hypothetical protein YPPY60_1321, partial [Yersinia pestis PY-60]|jgi:nucleoside-diphosphate-sugar epimerase